MRNRTTLVIAHRLSTIQHANRIVVMEGGRLIESGSHSQLMQANGSYALLYRMGFAAAQSPSPPP
jgi:subfamily B ATP-binding cassette protein MsbA